MTQTHRRLTEAIGQEFRRRLLEDYVPKIGQCVDLLSEEQLWQRPGPTCNSVANLLLHLDGNVTQWIQSGLGGREDHRQRDAEFASGQGETSANGAQLMARLTATVEEAVRIVEAMQPDDYLTEHVFQSRWNETSLAAILHVIEHFSGHAGQIYAFTKRELGIDLKFYDL